MRKRGETERAVHTCYIVCVAVRAQLSLGIRSLLPHWVPTIQLRLSGLCGKCFDLLSHLSSPLGLPPGPISLGNRWTKSSAVHVSLQGPLPLHTNRGWEYRNRMVSTLVTFHLPCENAFREKLKSFKLEIETCFKKISYSIRAFSFNLKENRVPINPSFSEPISRKLREAWELKAEWKNVKLFMRSDFWNGCNLSTRGRHLIIPSSGKPGTSQWFNTQEEFRSQHSKERVWYQKSQRESWGLLLRFRMITHACV